ncbi:hypothetical protein WICANDRAFT_93978, partial [Wickerhamomyces anomalus NRRL Y-366-8]
MEYWNVFLRSDLNKPGKKEKAKDLVLIPGNNQSSNNSRQQKKALVPNRNLSFLL